MCFYSSKYRVKRVLNFMRNPKMAHILVSAKINKVFLRPILQNLKGRSVLDKFLFENDPLDEPNQMPSSKKFYFLSKLVKNAKWWSKSNLPLSHSTAKFFPLKKGFKKYILMWIKKVWSSAQLRLSLPKSDKRWSIYSPANSWKSAINCLSKNTFLWWLYIWT